MNGRGMVMLAAAGGLAVLLPVAAGARTTQVVPYPPGEVWATAVRFLRVDRAYPIREKDETAGYVLFDYPERGKTFRGALELVATTDGDGRAATQVVVSLPELPRHYEIALVDKLTSKMREERGVPAPAPARRRPAVDGGDAGKQRGRPAADGAVGPAGLPRALEWSPP
jgi:hypothetical protein